MTNLEIQENSPEKKNSINENDEKFFKEAKRKFKEIRKLIAKNDGVVSVWNIKIDNLAEMNNKEYSGNNKLQELYITELHENKKIIKNIVFDWKEFTITSGSLKIRNIPQNYKWKTIYMEVWESWEMIDNWRILDKKEVSLILTEIQNKLKNIKNKDMIGEEEKDKKEADNLIEKLKNVDN